MALPAAACCVLRAAGRREATGLGELMGSGNWASTRRGPNHRSPSSAVGPIHAAQISSYDLMLPCWTSCVISPECL